jgi:hypothetical protein
MKQSQTGTILRTKSTTELCEIQTNPTVKLKLEDIVIESQAG